MTFLPLLFNDLPNEINTTYEELDEQVEYEHEVYHDTVKN